MDKKPKTAPPVVQIKPVAPTPTIPDEPAPQVQPANPVADDDGVIRQKTDFTALPGWEKSSSIPAFQAFLGSCQRFAKTKTANPAFDQPCAKAKKLADNPAGLSRVLVRLFFEAEFTPYFISVPETEQGLLTAYYEPELPVQNQQSPEFSEPILARPDDLVTVSLRRMDASLPDKRLVGLVKNGQMQPYFTRKQIRQTTGRPLAWGRPIDVFFLQVQGSGRIRFSSGKTMRAAFAGHNGRRYHSIGRELVKRGELAAGKASKGAIENWMQQAGRDATQNLMN
ncbi:Membrane-bound lytic murein transglycosylase A, partial [hydrothermal vent metagenome]